MVIEIEYYKGDTLLHGKPISFREFQKQMKVIDSLYDMQEDNFISLACRLYNWTVITEESEPVYVYDRDIKRAYQKNRKSHCLSGV